MNIDCYLVMDFFYYKSEQFPKEYLRTVERKLTLPVPPVAGMKVHLVPHIVNEVAYRDSRRWTNEHNAVRNDKIPIITGEFVLNDLFIVVPTGQESAYYQAGFDYTYQDYESIDPHIVQLVSAFGFTESDVHSLIKKNTQRG